jgi:hypothetical protein
MAKKPTTNLSDDPVALAMSATANGELVLCFAKLAKEKGVWPNRLGIIQSQPAFGALVSFRSETDFAIGRKPLDYLANWREIRVVILLERGDGGKYKCVNAMLLADVEEKLKNAPLYPGNFGSPFYWVNDRFESASRGGGDSDFR